MTSIPDARLLWLRALKPGDKVLVRGKGDEHTAVITKITSMYFQVGNARFDKFGRWGDHRVWKRIYPLEG